MRYPFQLTAMAIGSVALAACGEDTTEPASADMPAPALAVASNTWIKGANVPGIERFGPAVVSVKNAAGQSVVYVIGGCTAEGGGRNTVQAYDVTTNSWAARAPVPEPVCRSNGAQVIDGKIYLAGGQRHEGDDIPSNALYVYDPARNRWTRKRDMTTNGGSNGVSGVIKGKLYVLAGCNHRHCFPGGPLLHRYNPATDQWTTLTSETSYDGGTHEGGVAGVIDGKLYVVGGTTNQLDVYDPATDRWTVRAPLPPAQSHTGVSAAAVVDRKLYVIGGRRVNYLTETMDTIRTTSVYDPATNRWSTRAELPTPRARAAAAKVFVGGRPRIQLLGGSRPNNLQYVP